MAKTGLFLFLFTLMGCYTFKNISVPPELKTFTIIQFTNSARDVLPTLSIQLSEGLKDKVLNQSRLNYALSDGDAEFSGSITNYDTRPVAPEGNSIAAFTRLEIVVNVKYVNFIDEKLNWENRFERFEDFPATTNLTDVQDELVEKIVEDLSEDIFNKAFTNW